MDLYIHSPIRLRGTDLPLYKVKFISAVEKNVLLDRSVARQRLGRHFPAATNTKTKTEELLEVKKVKLSL
jgi:hypothetical protein